MGLKKASKTYNVPRSTLQRLTKEKYGNPVEASQAKVGRPPVFNKQLEEELVNYCLAMEASFFGLTRSDLRRMAVQLAEKNNVKHPFKNEMAGKKWVSLFLKRHKKKLAERKPTGTSYARALGFSKENTDKFFDLLEQLHEKNQYTPDRIFNVDESGISIVQSKVAKVIGLRGKRQVASLTSAERGSLITIVACMNAVGTFVPPLVIFPRKNMSESLKKGAPPGTIFAAHPSGWIQSNLFTLWFQHFIDCVKPTEDKPVLLVLDGHFSHTQNIDLIDLARASHISILSLPPHSSHKMQPLDRTFMGPLKVMYSEEIRQWLRHNNRPISAYDVMEMFGKAYIKCQRAEIAINGFRVTGIFPIKRNVFTDNEYIEEATKKPQNIGESIFSEDLRKTVSKTTMQTDEQNEVVEIDLSQPSTSKAFPSSSHESSQVSESCLQEKTPDKGSSQEEDESQRNGFKVSPFEINPVPKIKKRASTRGRKACCSTVITLSPYKLELEKAAKSRLEKEPKTSKEATKGGNHRTKSSSLLRKKGSIKKRLSFKGKSKTESSSSEDNISISSGSSDLEAALGDIPTPVEEDAECLFCGRKFSEDSKGENWIMCIMCSMWAHVECTGAEKDNYICDYCVSRK